VREGAARALFRVPGRKSYEVRTIAIVSKLERSGSLRVSKLPDISKLELFRHRTRHGCRPTEGTARTDFEIGSRFELSVMFRISNGHLFELRSVPAPLPTPEVSVSDFFRIQLGIVSRAEGHSAAKRSAYQSCGVIVAHDGERFDFSRKAKEHVRTIVLLPENAPGWARAPESLWQRAAQAERRVDAQEARIIDFSMPRAVPADLWEACIRHVYEPFVRMGMVLQVDVHDTPASDGGRNVNIHGLATLREIDGDNLAARKNRTWNDAFRQRNGREVREQFAERLTAFCQEHGISYQGDARPNAERDLPDPEPNLPRWNFEYAERTGTMPEALAVLHEHRRRRRQWEVAQAEAVEAALELTKLEVHIRQRRQRRLVPVLPANGRPSARRDRRAAILRAWHRNGWIDAQTIPAIASVRFDPKRDVLWIDLADGSVLVDRGDAITMQGPVTWPAALETAAAAERHGWKSVEVSGDQAYKDAVTVASMLRGIEVRNHVLSSKAQAIFDRLSAEQAKRSASPNGTGSASDHTREQPFSSSTASRAARPSSREIHRKITKRHFVESKPIDNLPDVGEASPAYRPRFALSRKVRSKLTSSIV
jgi:hypothetical protein